LFSVSCSVFLIAKRRSETSVVLLASGWKLTHFDVSWREGGRDPARQRMAAGGYFAGDVGPELATSREF